MEPTIVVALINAGVKLFGVFAQPKSAGHDRSSQAKVEKWAKENHELLERAVTVNSARLLAILETRLPSTVEQARELLFKDNDMSLAQLKRFDGEFHYRLEYLRQIGLVASGMREYRVSRLGGAFLAEARQRKSYGEALNVGAA